MEIRLPALERLLFRDNFETYQIPVDANTFPYLKSSCNCILTHCKISGNMLYKESRKTYITVYIYLMCTHILLAIFNHKHN